jgi:hypothetical protein
VATLKCLACGLDNKVGDESCSSCSSSLNLRLCSACEAINAHDAQRCHSCGAQFSAEAPAAATVVEEIAQEAPPSEKVLPAAWVLGAEEATRRGRRAAAVLWLLPLAAVASSAYYFYGTPQAASKPAALNHKIESAATKAAPLVLQSAPAPIVTHTRADSVAALVKAAPAATAAVAPAGQIAKSQPISAATNAAPLVPVTHTRAESLAAPAVAPQAAPAVVLPVKESAPTAERRPRVTHTKAEAPEAAEPVVVRAASGASVPSTEAKVEPAACAPGVAALGLCKSK